MRKYPKLDDHEEVALEQREVREQWKSENKGLPLMLLIGFLWHLVPVTLLAVVTRWWFGADALAPIIVVSAAWVAGTVATWSSVLYERVKRMEAHGLTVHNELLKVRDKVLLP